MGILKFYTQKNLLIEIWECKDLIYFGLDGEGENPTIVGLTKEKAVEFANILLDFANKQEE